MEGMPEGGAKQNKQGRQGRSEEAEWVGVESRSSLKVEARARWESDSETWEFGSAGERGVNEVLHGIGLMSVGHTRCRRGVGDGGGRKGGRGGEGREGGGEGASRLVVGVDGG